MDPQACLRRFTIFALLVAACGTDTAMPDSGNPPTDGAMPVSDGPVIPPVSGLVAVTLDCQPFAREVRHVSTDNSRDITINSYAITTLTRADRFVLSKCDAPKAPTCSASDACSGELEPAAGQICATEQGTFFDGKLVVLCGTRTERYLASGTLSATTQTTFSMTLELFQ